MKFKALSWLLNDSDPLPGHPGRKDLKDYTEQELEWFLDHNTMIYRELSGIRSEILIRKK